MGIVEQIVNALTSFVTGSANAIGEGLEGLLFVVDQSGTVTALSSAGQVIFTIVGVGFGVGMFYVILNLFRM